MIPLAKPMIGPEEIEAAERILKSGQLAQGPEVEKFEEEFAEYIGVDHAVAVSNGTVALVAAIRAFDFTYVSVPAFSFVSTATAVLLADARLVFRDVGLSDFTSPGRYVSPDFHHDPAVVVHLYGYPCDMGNIRNPGVVIEDCAQAVGAEYNGRKVGSLGDAGCFSFYATKNMTSGGEGGMVTTNSRAVADHVRRFRNHGDIGKYTHVSLGGNYRMTDLQAAIGRVQLRHLDDWNTMRIFNATYYNQTIESPGVVLPTRSAGSTHVYHQYVLRITEDCPLTRDQFLSYLQQRGIGCAVHYPMPIPHQPVFDRIDNCKWPNALLASRRVVSIPVGPWVTEEERKYIVETINGVGQE